KLWSMPVVRGWSTEYVRSARSAAQCDARRHIAISQRQRRDLSLLAGLVVRRKSRSARAERGAYPQGRAARRRVPGQLRRDDRRRRGVQSRKSHTRLKRGGLRVWRSRAKRGPGGGPDG